MNKSARNKLEWMINFRKNLRSHAVVRGNYLDAAVLDEQIKGIEAAYEVLNGTGVLDFELDRKEGGQDGKAGIVHKDV